MRDFESIKKEAQELKKQYAKRDMINKKYDRMDGNEWGLPEELSGVEGIRKTVAPDPAAALQTAVKVLSAETPNIKVTPAGPSADDRATANKIERGLLWELKAAARRSQTKLVPDIIRSAVKYGEVAVYIDYLPHSIEGFPERRKKQILRNGKFALIPHNPSTVYPRFSPLGLEAVLAVKMMSAKSAVDYYGEDASALAERVKEKKADFDVEIWDWTDYDQKCVWAVEGDEESKPYKIINEERDADFLPWVIRMSGTALEDEPHKQRKAFLNIVEEAGLWEDMNIMGTLVNSEVLSYAAAPRGIVEGPNGEQVAVDYGEMNKPIKLLPGQKYTPIDPPKIDQALTEILDRTKAKLEAATSVQVLQNLNFPAGTAYATINAVLQTAISSLQPFKVLAEMALADMFIVMLLWIDYANGRIVSYGTGRDEAGKEYEVSKQDFSTNALYIEVALNASAPTDFMQRINAATLLFQLGMPKARLFEDLNIGDPEQAIIERYLEDLTDNEMQLAIQQRIFEAQQEQQLAQQPPQPNLQNMAQGPPESPGFSNIEGQGFNPNLGGQPPAVTASGLTREELNQATRGGEEIAEIP